jgi:transposase InsO family protein
VQCIDFFKSIVSIHRSPEVILTGTCPQFKSSEFDARLKKHGIIMTNTNAYHPQTNGRAERVNGETASDMNV